MRKVSLPRGVPTPQFGIVVLRLRTALHFACAVFRVFAPLSPVSPAHSPLAARGYGPAYFRASPSKLPGPSRPLASLTAARCSGAADALWACPRASSRFAAFDCALRFASCARHSSPSGLRRSQAHSRRSLLHWAHRRLLHPQFAMVVLLRPTACSTPLLIGLTTACFAHCARPPCAPLAAPPLSPSLGLLRAASFHNSQ